MNTVCSFFIFFVLNGLSLDSLVSSSETNHLTCTTNEECQSFIQNSICEKGYCQCSPDKLRSSDGSKCLDPVKEFGSRCEDNVQCSKLLSQGVCLNNQCKCGVGYHYLKGFCWKSFKLNEACQKNEHCSSDHEYIGFECKNQICKCRTGYYERLTSGCRRERKNSESCNLDSDCRDQTTCERMVCTKTETPRNFEFLPEEEEDKKVENTLNCPKGMFEKDNKCVLELGMPCTTDESCTHISNAICLDGLVCACQPPIYVASENNRKCLRAPRGQVEDVTKSTCQEDVQCGVFGGNAACVNKKCSCKENSYWEVDSKYCWPITPLGDVCKDNKDCHPLKRNAECVQNGSKKECRCKKGYHKKEDTCVLDSINVGDNCEDDEECLFPNSVCDESSNKCACKENYYVENKKCVPGVKSSCTKNEDCNHLKNTECKKGDSGLQCLCFNGHVSSNDGRYCLPAAKFNEKCLESFQCKHFLGDLGECIDNTCLCNQTAHYSNEKCYKSKFVGESCSRQPDCFPGNDPNSVICLKGQCACHYDYQLDGNRLCVKKNSAAAFGLYPTLLAFLCLLVALTK